MAERGVPEEYLTRANTDIRDLDQRIAEWEARSGLHYTPQDINTRIKNLGMWEDMGRREIAGQTPLARRWEQTADSQVIPHYTVDEYSPPRTVSKLFGLPEGKTVPEGTTLHEMSKTRPSQDLGFDHLIDELSNALNPQSGLPKELLLEAKNLGKVTPAQAAEHVDKINAWRQVQADLVSASRMEGIPVHKEYESGYKWLRPGDLSQNEKALQYALECGKNGAWCTSGKDTALRYGSGGSELYVLHDPKGKPIVQIEVGNKKYNPDDLYMGDVLNEEDALGDQTYRVLQEILEERGVHNAADLVETEAMGGRLPEEFRQVVREAWDEVDSRMPKATVAVEQPFIKQIKRKGNLVNSDDYEGRQAVQDFVKSGKWSAVDDIENTGLMGHQDAWRQLREIDPARANKFMDEAPPDGWFSKEDLDKFAKGGHVTPDQFDAIIAALTEGTR
jgi:hypothetical protein